MRIELQLTDQMQELIQELGETPRDPGVAKVQRLALRIFNSNVEQATRIRELEAKLEAYERQPADYASRPVSHIDMLSHEQAQDELRYACGALDVAERRERELEAEVGRLRRDDKRLRGDMHRKLGNQIGPEIFRARHLLCSSCTGKGTGLTCSQCDTEVANERDYLLRDRHRLRGCLSRLASNEAFHVATANVSTEARMRMEYAEAALAADEKGE